MRRAARRLALAPASAASWDALAVALPGHTAFHRLDWLQREADLHGWRLELLAATVDRRPVGLVPLLLQRRGPVWTAADVLVPYVGPLVVRPGLLQGLLDAVRRWSVPRRVLLVRLGFPSPDAVPAEVAGWGRAWSAGTSYAVDLRGLGDGGVQLGLNRNTRRSLGRAEAAGVQVRDATEDEVRTWVPQLLEEAFGVRGRASPYPAGTGERIWAGLVHAPAGRVVARAATVDGRPGGLLVTLFEQDAAATWVGGGFRAERGSAPNTALHVDALEAAAARGCSRVDLVGHVDEGVARFKTGLGAAAFDLHELVQDSVPLPRRRQRQRV